MKCVATAIIAIALIQSQVLACDFALPLESTLPNDPHFKKIECPNLSSTFGMSINRFCFKTDISTDRVRNSLFNLPKEDKLKSYYSERIQTGFLDDDIIFVDSKLLIYPLKQGSFFVIERRQTIASQLFDILTRPGSVDQFPKNCSKFDNVLTSGVEYNHCSIEEINLDGETREIVTFSLKWIADRSLSINIEYMIDFDSRPCGPDLLRYQDYAKKFKR